MLNDHVNTTKFPPVYWAEWSSKIISALNLKQTAKGEYHGPCPNCGGDDRFWISEKDGEVKLHCRQCNDFQAIASLLRGDGLLPDLIEQPKAQRANVVPFDVQYHIKKGVELHNAKLEGMTVVVPIMSVKGEVIGHQKITPDGRKKFTAGMKKDGAFSPIGGKLEGLCYVAEGWATAASVHEATGRPCVFALDAGNLPKTIEALREIRPNAEFVVAADNDEKGIKAAVASGCQYALPPQGKDWNDVHQESGLEAVREGLLNLIEAGKEIEVAAKEATEGEVQYNFARDNNGNVVFNHHNALEILTKMPEWKDVFAFDEFAQRKMVMQQIPNTSGNPKNFRPRELRDSDYIAVIRWFNNNGFLRASKNTICDVVDAACYESVISPVKYYLEELGDRAERNPQPDEYLDTWTIRMLGVEPQSAEHRFYIYEVSRKWLIAAVARAIEAGCKADGVLILEGTQGAGKSTALRILAGDEWFGDALPSMHTKDASDYLRGKWIVELAELSNINKAEVEIVKAFVSRTEERFRPAYGRSEICYPRSCVFAGTTNKADYLRDETGNRRFWPIRCGEIDLELIKEEREMLLGEAVRAYRSGEKWWLSGAAEQYAKTEQDKRLAVDDWTGPIKTFCDGIAAANGNVDEVAILEVAEQALDLPVSQVHRQITNRISSILTSLGYEKAGVFTSGPNRNRVRFKREVNSNDY